MSYLKNFSTYTRHSRLTIVEKSAFSVEKKFERKIFNSVIRVLFPFPEPKRYTSSNQWLTNSCQQPVYVADDTSHLTMCASSLARNNHITLHPFASKIVLRSLVRLWINWVMGLIDGGSHFRMRIILGKITIWLLVFYVCVPRYSRTVPDCVRTCGFNRNSPNLDRAPRMRESILLSS